MNLPEDIQESLREYIRTLTSHPIDKKGKNNAYQQFMEAVEYLLIDEVLYLHRYNATSASKAIGINRNTLTKRASNYGVKLKRNYQYLLKHPNKE